MQRHFYTGLLTIVALYSSPVAAATAADFPWLSERKILGVNSLEPIANAAGTSAFDAARAVARVETRADGFGFCTGSRIAEDLFITNFHCDQGCNGMQFKLGYEADLTVDQAQTYTCKDLVRKSEKYDYALYRVNPTTSYSTLTFPPLTISVAALEIGQRMIVPSHPNGRLKEIDRSVDCIISSIDIFTTESGRDTVKHMCDTEGGSSGSPVIDRDTGYFVALHWGGRTNEFNMAIPMSSIVGDLRANLSRETIAGLNIVN